MAEEKKFEDAARRFAGEYFEWVSWFYPTKEDLQQIKKRWPLLNLGTPDTTEDEVNEIVAFRQQQKQVIRKKDLQDKVNRIKKNITDGLLDELIEAVRPNIKVGQETALKNQIRQAIKEMEYPNDYEELAATVEMVLESKYVPKKTTSYKTYLSFAWTIGIDVISLLVLLAIFNSTYDNQQKVVLAILMLIYLAVRTLAVGIGWAVLQGFMGIEAEFQRIRTLLNEEIGKEELEKAEQTKKTFNKTMGKSIIDAIFLSIAYLATVWMLLSALGII